VPSPTPAFQPLKFGVLGDIRTAGARPPQVAYQIIERMKAEKPQAVMTVGDMINAESNAAAVRNQWLNLVTAINALAPANILPTVGNHETNGQKGVLPYYIEAFSSLPDNGPEGYKKLTYSMDIASVHFVSITSEHPNRFHYLGDEQLNWLEKDLAANKKPYTFVFSHDPAYPVGPHTGSSLDAYPKDRDRLWKIMQTYKVTAYIAGHEHLYNRSARGGMTQLVIGTSGSAIYGGYGGEFYHYGIFDVTPNGVNVKIYDSQGKQRDSFTLL
jgi:3',5'-cyclic-AMP phosphodiesterase